MRIVHNMSTLEEITFDTDNSKKAVKLAVLYERGITGLVDVDKDPWPFDTIYKGKHSVGCGDWCCLVG